MMTIDYETSLKLKEIGFDEQSEYYFDEYKNRHRFENPNAFYAKNSKIEHNRRLRNIFNKSVSLRMCTSPNFDSVAKFFRSEYGLHISVDYINNRWLYKITSISKDVTLSDNESKPKFGCKTYNSTFKTAILYIIELIKNNKYGFI